MKFYCLISISAVVWIMGAIAPALAASQIIEIQGSVAIKRKSASQYQSVSVGAAINLGDLIRPAHGARVKVRCYDNTVWSVPAELESGLGAGCPDSVATRSLDARGGDDFLEFLAQRYVYATQVSEVNPLLRWQAILNTAQYRVQVMAGEQQLWKTTVEGNSNPVIRYTGELLKSDVDYQLVVTAIAPQGTQTKTTLLFRRLAETEIVTTTAAQITAQDMSDEARAIALAALYQDVAQLNTDPPANRGLIFEAIPKLEAVVAQGSPTPYVHRLLGDLYLQVGWLESAEQRYQEAIALAHLAQDRQDWAAAQVGLASIAAARDEQTAARQWLQGAKVGYKLLNEADQVEVIDQWLGKLNL